MILVKYTCRECGIDKAVVQVTPRGFNEPVLQWIATMQDIIALDHALRSPSCHSKNCDVMIPIAGVNQIGGEPIN